MQYDPTLYTGSAPYYARGRPPYSRELMPILAKIVPLDYQSRVLDVGTGTGVLAVMLAPAVQSVVAVDPDAEMLSEGRRAADAANISNIYWLRSRAEELRDLELGTSHVAVFGQSFQWTDRTQAAEIIYDLLKPRGVIVLISHAFEGRPVPAGPGHPLIPHAAIRGIIELFLGPKRRAGQGLATPSVGRDEDALSRTRFGAPQRVYAAGRPTLCKISTASSPTICQRRFARHICLVIGLRSSSQRSAVSWRARPQAVSSGTGRVTPRYYMPGGMNSWSRKEMGV